MTEHLNTPERLAQYAVSRLNDLIAQAMTDQYNAEHAHGPTSEAASEEFARCAEAVSAKVRPLIQAAARNWDDCETKWASANVRADDAELEAQRLRDALTVIAGVQHTRAITADGPSLSLDADKKMRDIALDALNGQPVEADLYDRARVDLLARTRNTPLFEGGKFSAAWQRKEEQLSELAFCQREQLPLPTWAATEGERA